MFSTLLDRLGDWNPQLLRELKGRLKPRNIAITIALSSVIQFIVFGLAWVALPGNATPEAIKHDQHPFNRYCTGEVGWQGLVDLSGGYSPCKLIPLTRRYAVNWQAWNEDLFIYLSLIITFALLVIGSYLLLSNLDQEQRRGSLNFIRLSPRSAITIFGGQLMGVPVLVYLAIVLAIPLQLKAALGAGLETTALVGFWGLVGITSLTLYSIALLFGLISFGLGGFQAWLASGLIFGLEIVATVIGCRSPLELTAFNWLGLFSPLTSLRYLAPNGLHYLLLRFDSSNHISAYFFGGHSLDFSGFALLAWVNALLVIGCTGYALHRKFHNPAIPLVRRRESYLMTLCFEGMILGFTLQPLSSIDNYWSPDNWTESAFTSVVLLNLVFFLVLIVALSPTWQTLQDWSRFRQMSAAKSGRRSLLFDLVWGEKSPPLVAFALNLAIALACLGLWILLSPIRYKAIALWGLMVCSGLQMVYACLSHLIMLTPLKQRGVWAAAAIAASLFLPLVALRIFYAVPMIGLLAPIVAPWFILKAPVPFVMPPIFSVLSQWAMVAPLSLISMQRLHRLGQSASQRVLAGSGQ